MFLYKRKEKKIINITHYREKDKFRTREITDFSTVTDVREKTCVIRTVFDENG